MKNELLNFLNNKTNQNWYKISNRPDFKEILNNATKSVFYKNKDITFSDLRTIAHTELWRELYGSNSLIEKIQNQFSSKLLYQIIKNNLEDYIRKEKQTRKKKCEYECISPDGELIQCKWKENGPKNYEFCNENYQKAYCKEIPIVIKTSVPLDTAINVSEEPNIFKEIQDSNISKIQAYIDKMNITDKERIALMIFLNNDWSISKISYTLNIKKDHLARFLKNIIQEIQNGIIQDKILSDF